MGITERLEEQEIEAALQREIPNEPEMLGTYPKGWCKSLGCPVKGHRS